MDEKIIIMVIGGVIAWWLNTWSKRYYARTHPETSSEYKTLCSVIVDLKSQMHLAKQNYNTNPIIGDQDDHYLESILYDDLLRNGVLDIIEPLLRVIPGYGKFLQDSIKIRDMFHNGYTDGELCKKFITDIDDEINKGVK